MGKPLTVELRERIEALEKTNENLEKELVSLRARQELKDLTDEICRGPVVGGADLENYISFQEYIDDMRVKDEIIRDHENELEEVYRQNRRIKEEMADVKRTLDHRDNMIVKLYDLLRNDDISNPKKLEIIRIIVDAESDEPLDLNEDIIDEMFRAGLFR